VRSAYYVYAIVGRDAPLPAAATGGGAAELTTVPWRELAAVTARLADDRALLTTEAILHHEAVVEAVRQSAPALPVRFGTLFRDAPSVASALAERYDALTSDLDRLGDKVELSLTALWAAPGRGAASGASRHGERSPRGPGAGARYLFARAAKLRDDDALVGRAREVARKLERVLGGRALEQRVSLLPTPRVAVRAAYLLDPAAVGAFRAAFDALGRGRREVRLLLTGPWPPYSFVRRTEAEGGVASDRHLGGLAHILTDAMRDAG
jgi:hypothetical protein